MAEPKILEIERQAKRWLAAQHWLNEMLADDDVENLKAFCDKVARLHPKEPMSLEKAEVFKRANLIRIILMCFEEVKKQIEDTNDTIESIKATWEQRADKVQLAHILPE